MVDLGNGINMGPQLVNGALIWAAKYKRSLLAALAMQLFKLSLALVAVGVIIAMINQAAGLIYLVIVIPLVWPTFSHVMRTKVHPKYAPQITKIE